MTSEPNIIRKGVWPILKYTVRVWGYHVVMIDDQYGDLVIASERGAFKHWWGKSGRGTNTLREFLIKTSDGYIEDKLSYGLSRWDGDEAMKEVYKICEEKWGHIGEWPHEVAEALEDDAPRSSGEMYYRLYGIDEFSEAFPDPHVLPGDRWANKDVRLFVKNVWPTLVEYWRDELGAETKFEQISAGLEYP